jgi:hypothetical protein
MTNIFNFRPKKAEPLNSDFLNESDDTVEFDLTGREVQMGDLPQHFLRADLPSPVMRDWSNQELANIYRVKKLLDAAGVPNTLERGVTDEGDPWCIFCTFSGDVFIHLCRVDGRYTLDSPNLRKPIGGLDFSDLIAEFSAGALAKSPTDGNRRVIQLQRNGKVFLHPSALLAALIWSIYINSEDLVMLAPQDSTGAPDADDNGIQLINEAAMAPLSDSEATAVAHFMDTPLTAGQILSARASESASLRMDDDRDTTMLRDFSSKSAMLANAGPIAVGLSAIAIAFGIMTENFFDPDSDTDLALLDQPVIDTVLDDLIPVEHDSNTAARSGQFDLAAVLQAVFDHVPTPDVAPSALSTEIAADIDLSTLLSSILALPRPADVALNLASGFHDSWVDEEPAPLLFADEALAEPKAATTDGDPTPVKTTRTTTDGSIDTADITSISPTTSDTSFDFAWMLDFTNGLAEAFKTFNFGGVQIQATFDIASITNTSVGDASTAGPSSGHEHSITELLINTLSDPGDTIELDDFSSDPGPMAQIYDPLDVNARAFIQHLMLMSKSGDVEVIQTHNELILLDSEAMDNSDQALQMGWILADGNTVYTIGMRADYMDFDLIA